ncbi:hypothetical protein HID58_090747 [Brassica napus]|uniref:Sulfate adenylyltransferase n=1 Tax=Brassica napus TaxID=3708 RepID=A0ABQ7XAD4_BRANA|nr:hypothetical protein HID58_090747 [Brassica napus]
MASMSAVLSKSPFLSQPLSKSPSSDLPFSAATVSFPSKSHRRGGRDGGEDARRSTRGGAATRGAHGDRRAVDARAERRLGKSARRLMRESEFLQTLHFNSLRLDDGSVVNMSVPIVLAIDDEQKASIGESKRVALVGSDGNPVAILSDIEIYKTSQGRENSKNLGYDGSRLPYVEEAITNAGNWLIGLSPAELRKELEKRWADGCVFAFQLRNPVHNGGYTKADDVPLSWRMKQHEKVLSLVSLSARGRCFDPETTVVSIFPSPMHYAGPTEVQWHAKARINAGANFYIVGRDPAGMGHPVEKRDLYDADHGKNVLSMALDLKDSISFLSGYMKTNSKVAAYDKTQGKMASLIPRGLKISYAHIGQEQRKPSGWIHVPGGWQVLVDYYDSLTPAGKLPVPA